MLQGLGLVLLAALAVLPDPGCASGPASCGQGCSVVYATDGSLALAGNNEDYVIPLAKVWFVPASPGSFGGVYFGFDNYFAQGGMNDQGLFFDALALSETVPVAVEGREPAATAPGDMVMAQCGTVACAVDIFERYSFGESWSFQLFFGDATGESAIVEPGRIIRQRGGFQVATNFRLSATPEDEISCPRYLTAVEMLESMEALSVEGMRAVLDAVHVEEGSQTLYSNVYDLANRRVHLYYFHDYEHGVVFDLAEELAQGAHSYDLPALFPPNPAAEAWAALPLRRYQRLVDGRRATGDDLPDLGAYEGEYTLPAEWSPGGTVVVSATDESLLLQFPDASRYELHPESDVRFFHVGFRGPDPAIIFEGRFEFDDAGRVGALVLEWGGDGVVLSRVGPGGSTEDGVPPATAASTSAPTTSAGSAVTSTVPLSPSGGEGGSGARWLWVGAASALAAAGLGGLMLRRRRPGG